MKKKFFRCYAPWLKDGAYTVTNIGVEIVIYIQIFTLEKATSFLEGIHRSNLIIKKQTNKGVNFRIDITSTPSPPVRIHPHFDGFSSPLNANVMIDSPLYKDNKFIKEKTIMLY